MKWAFRLYCAACILEGAAVIAAGVCAALMLSYLQNLGDTALLTDPAYAWLQQVLTPWQQISQSLTMNLLPLASAVLLLWALLLQLPCRTVLRRALPPAVLSLGLPALVLFPLWKSPHLFLGVFVPYIYWFIALLRVVIVFLLYLVLYAVFRAARRRENSRSSKNKTE